LAFLGVTSPGCVMKVFSLRSATGAIGRDKAAQRIEDGNRTIAIRWCCLATHQMRQPLPLTR
jgi:hypothetical protein